MMIESVDDLPVDQSQCSQESHVWIAVFLVSGRLAYWKCELCGLADRETESLPERLDENSGWNPSPPKLTAQGPFPPVSTRWWRTTEGTILFEGEPSSTHFMGVPIPSLAAAHSYVERDAQDDTIVAVYEPGRERLGKYSDHYYLTRFQVVGNALVRFKSHCYEESTFDIPNAGKPKQRIVLQGLELLQPQ